jgi:hypothetical protein
MSDHQFQEREFESGEAVDLLDLILGGQTGPMSGRLGRKETQELLDSFPRLSEGDLIKLDKDTTCPVCITPLSAIIAEEEMALAMDSPAHAFEKMGVTKLWIESREEGQRGCGHLFCRRCISKWIGGGHDSCPTCRYLLIPHPADSDSASANPADVDDALRLLQHQMQELRELRALLEGNNHPSSDENGQGGRQGERQLRDFLPGMFGEEERAAREDDRSEYAGMYS